MQAKTFYMALLIILLLLVLMELMSYTSTGYFGLGFFCLTGLTVPPA